MNLTLILSLVGGLFVLLLIALVYVKRIPKKLKTDKYTDDWKVLQAMCRDKKTWPDAIKHADRLLDKALRRRKFRGKSTGERLASAQRKFSNNDAVWFSHNLYKKILDHPDVSLKEADVRTALVGFRQGLRDLGALESQEPVAKEET